MKKIKFYIIIFTLGFIVYGCDKPAPTELIQDTQPDDPVSVEVITKDINNDTDGNGYDSTGVIEDNFAKYSNVIAVSGTKITRGNVTFNSSLALAVFFDKSKPIFASDGKRIGFTTRALGSVEFDGIKTHLLPFIKRFRFHNTSLDTVLGLFHYLYSGRNNQADPFRFNYNSAINFKLSPVIGNPVEFNIPTPPEITASVKLEGEKKKNLKILLEWNAFQAAKFEIIIGVSIKGHNRVLPIYKIKTRDDGRFVIPQNLLESLPSDKFDRLSISLIRKYEADHSENGNDIHVLSQSVHTINIKNP